MNLIEDEMLRAIAGTGILGVVFVSFLYALYSDKLVTGGRHREALEAKDTIIAYQKHEMEVKDARIEELWQLAKEGTFLANKATDLATRKR